MGIGLKMFGQSHRMRQSTLSRCLRTGRSRSTHPLKMVRFVWTYLKCCRTRLTDQFLFVGHDATPRISRSKDGIWESARVSAHKKVVGEFVEPAFANRVRTVMLVRAVVFADSRGVSVSCPTQHAGSSSSALIGSSVRICVRWDCAGRRIP
jgi:hypothetical protein